jgi:hypothetical protein
MATLACLETDDEFHAKDVVKVSDLDRQRAVLSRAAIGSRETALRHIGVYAYRRTVLERFVALEPSPSNGRNHSNSCGHCSTALELRCYKQVSRTRRRPTRRRGSRRE